MHRIAMNGMLLESPTVACPNQKGKAATVMMIVGSKTKSCFLLALVVAALLCFKKAASPATDAHPLRARHAASKASSSRSRRGLLESPKQFIKQYFTVQPLRPIPPPNGDETTITWTNIASESAATRRSCGECCGYGAIERADAYCDLDPWYKKVLNYKGSGFLITSSDATADNALYEAALTLDRMTKKRPDFVRTLVDEGVKFTIVAQTEPIQEVPEYADIPPSL